MSPGLVRRRTSSSVKGLVGECPVFVAVPEGDTYHPQVERETATADLLEIALPGIAAVKTSPTPQRMMKTQASVALSAKGERDTTVAYSSGGGGAFRPAEEKITKSFRGPQLA
jgi:hypothetical protein